MNRVKAYIKKSDGYLPIYFYQELVDAGAVDRLGDFVWPDSVVHPYMLHVPPRINPDLSKNIKASLFRLHRKDLHETWICFLDGTWARWSHSGGYKWPGDQASKSPPTYQQWETLFREAGYPHWKSLEDKAEWTKKHQDQLVWNEQMSMYVLGRQ